MCEKVHKSLLLLISGATILATALALEIEQFPEQNAVEIRQGSNKILRFQVRENSLERVSVQYGINGTREKYHPINLFNYNAIHSAVTMPCHINNTYDCTELYIRIEGTKEINNTSFHLVLIEMLHRTSFRHINVPNYFTVHISTPNTTDSTTPSASTTSVSTLPTIPTTHSTTPSTLPTNSHTTTKPSSSMFPTKAEDSSSNNASKRQFSTETILFTALAGSAAVLILSCLANIILLCCLLRRPRKPQTYAVSMT